MTFICLWKNRERPRLFTKRWLKVWAKRVWNMPSLLSVTLRAIRYKIKGAKIGRLATLGVLDMNGSASRLTIGDESFISTGVHLALHERIIIGNRVVINTGVQLLTASHDTSDPAWGKFEKPIVIGDYVWIANGAIILPGVTIGRGAVIGAGAVVSKDVPEYGIAVGNPAKLIANKRPANLDYDTVKPIACYEAWLGREKCTVL